jgi:cell wall-associated NlpC family hydrolase
VSTGRTYRTRGLALAAITSTALIGMTLIPGSAVADPKPTLPQARAQVADLQHKAEEAGEAANDLSGDIRAATRRVKAISADIRKQQVQVDAVKQQIGALAVAGYQQSGMTTTAQLLLSSDPDQFLSQASTAQAFAGQQSTALRRFQTAQGKLADLQAGERTELAALQAVQAKQDELKKEIEKNLAAAERVLSRLDAAERAKLEAEEAEEARRARLDRANRSTGRTSVDINVPASGRAKIAVDYALNQLGDPYVWAADGPDSFDCSGLTMAAWGKAGVSLSHSSKAQYNEGRRVSKSNLQPGDLVFYYSPISHVAIYLGNDRIVHASRPGKPVKIDELDLMPYTGAVRPG